MQETSWFIPPASFSRKLLFSNKQKIHIENSWFLSSSPCLEPGVSKCDKVARKRSEDKDCERHIYNFSCPSHYHPNFKNCFELLYLLKVNLLGNFTYRKMHKSQPLFTKWAHLCNQLQLKKHVTSTQEPLSCLFQSPPSAHINFSKGFSLILLSTTLWTSEDNNCYWPHFTNKDIKAQKIWSDLPKVTATGMSAFKSHFVAITSHRHCVNIIVID